MYTGIMHTHTLVVILFVLIYLIKTIMLLFASEEKLNKFSKKIRIPEIVVSTLFLATGIYLAYNTGNVGNWLYIKLLVVFASIPLAVVAFKKRNKILGVLAFMMMIYAYGISESKSPTFKRPDMSNAYQGLTGQEIFTMECVKCHGVDGRGVLSGAKNLTVSELSIDEKLDIIRNGKNAMNPYGKVFSDEELNAVGNYVHSLVNKK
jgi:mono/diheme cytochrome c family protein